jgi:hypothetical protein
MNIINAITLLNHKISRKMIILHISWFGGMNIAIATWC